MLLSVLNYILCIGMFAYKNSKADLQWLLPLTEIKLRLSNKDDVLFDGNAGENG